jgi:aspartate/methionine/tyrosine aminotransferase
MKLAWIIVSGPQPLVEAAQARLEIIADTYLSVNTPTQNALADWFSLKGEIQEEISARLEENLEFLKKELKDFNTAQLFNTEGGWYVILRIPATKTEEEWVLEFLKEDRVFVHPGYFFDFDEEAHIVLSLLPAIDVFQKGIKGLFKRIKAGS